MLIEICAANQESIETSAQCGIKRIELCSALGVGGLTPSPALLEHALRSGIDKTFVLIRPRAGNFTYSSREFDLILREADIALTNGASGIVSGMLTSNGDIALEQTAKLIGLCGADNFTFHRAIDLSNDLLKSTEELKGIGVKRILSSGGRETAPSGISVLNSMQKIGANDMIIMPGCGIHSQNIHEFVNHGFREVHLSASHVPSNETSYPNKGLFDLDYKTSSPDEIEACKRVLNTQSP